MSTTKDTADFLNRMKETDETKTVNLDTARAEEALAQSDEMMKKASETMADILTLLDTLPLHQRKRIARATAVYYEVYR